MEFGLSAAMTYDEAMVDGYQWTDVVKLIKPATMLPAAIAGVEKIGAELADLDPEERAELEKLVETLAFNSDGTEQITEEAVKTGLQIVKLIRTIREFRRN